MARQRRAVLALFVANGAGFASWLPRIPEVRDRLDLSLGGLGSVLLGAGLGGLVSSAASSVLVDRVSSRRSCAGSALALAAGLPLIGLAPNALTLAVALAVLGAVDALADIGMNVQAAQVDARTERSVIQGFHAWWSVGTVAGAGGGSAAAAFGIGLTLQLSITAVLLVVLVVWASPSLSPTDDPHVGPEDGGTRRRRGLLSLLAGLALALAVLEGAPGEWAALFGTDVLGASEGVAGLGFLAVSTGMVAGRFAGDRATDRLGAQQVFRVALAGAVAGIAVVLTAPSIEAAIAGFAVIGLGISVLFPALYLTAASTPGVRSGMGLGVMTSGARIGFLVSPLAVGWLSDATSLRAGLGTAVLGAAGAVTVLTAMLRRVGR